MTEESLLLVGSIPFDTSQEVFLAASETLGEYLDSIPDGEVLDRRYWILRLAFQLFNGHPAFEIVHRPQAPAGSEKLIPAGLEDMWRFRLRADVERVGFDMPGWRLGFAKDAQNSFAIFSALKRDGRIRPEARFQVSIPSVNSTCNPAMFGTDEAALKIIRDGLTEALTAEVENICRIIPAEELAIQFDCSFEVTDVHGEVGLPVEGSIERNIAQIGPLTKAVSADTRLGFHLCFGTFGGWPRFAPKTLARTVALANAISQASARPVDWMHIPALDTLDEAFYAPLAELRLKDARVYLGLVHSMDSFAERYRLARKFLRSFGLGAYCGLGRLSREAVHTSFRDHLIALDQCRHISAEA